MAPCTATILIVDDDPEVLSTIAVMVRRTTGCRVLEASSGDEALALFAVHRDEIGLLLTDLMMPGMSGRRAAEMITAHHGSLPVIFMSGYVDESRTGSLGKNVRYIQKPMQPQRLKALIRELLEESTA